MLAGDTPELSPGFYTRARARFEEAAGRGGRRRGWRVLSWEAAGLAVAAVLALALFLPPIVEQTREDALAPAPTSAPQRMQETEQTLAKSEVALDEERAAPGPAVGGRVDAPAEMQGAGELRETAEKKNIAESDVARDEGLAAPGKSSAGFAPEPPARDRTAADEDAGARLEEDAPRPLPGQPEYAREKRARVGAMMEQVADDMAKQAERETAVPPSVTRVVPLPVGFVRPASVRVVEVESVWNSLLQGEAGPSLAPLGRYRAGSRLVLVGPLGGMGDCSHVRVLAEADGYRVVTVRFAGYTESSGGCAFTLPADGKSVRVDE